MDGSSTGGFRADRHPSESYEDILERDSVGAPDHLRQHPRWDEGTDAIPIERYYDPGYFAKEVKYLWSKVWQWACREEEIPNVGDYRIYENVGKSLIVVRAPDMSIKAFYNSCLHRGRKLVTLNGCRNEFRCPYHGMAWNGGRRVQGQPDRLGLPAMGRQGHEPAAGQGRHLGRLRVRQLRPERQAADRLHRPDRRSLRALRLEEPLQGRAYPKGGQGQLEGGDRGFHGKPPQHHHPPADPALPGRRQQPVRHPQRLREPAVLGRRGAEPLPRPAAERDRNPAAHDRPPRPPPRSLPATFPTNCPRA